MTKDLLNARLAALREHLNQLAAQINATQGRISECDYWLGELDKPTEKVGPILVPDAPE